MYSIISDAKKYLNEINLSTDNICKKFSSTEKQDILRHRQKLKT